MSTILQQILDRRSVMAFLPEAINDNDIKTIINAAMLSPSAYNEQPWFFFVANRKNESQFARVLGALAPANQEWAKNAGALIICAFRKYSSKTGKENPYAMHDLGLATSFLLLQAQALGYVSHAMAGFDAVAMGEVLDIDDNLGLASVVAIGRHGDIEKLSEQNRQRELSMRSIKDFAEVAKILKVQRYYLRFKVAF